MSCEFTTFLDRNRILILNREVPDPDSAGISLEFRKCMSSRLGTDHMGDLKQLKMNADSVTETASMSDYYRIRIGSPTVIKTRNELESRSSGLNSM